MENDGAALLRFHIILREKKSHVVQFADVSSSYRLHLSPSSYFPAVVEQVRDGSFMKVSLTNTHHQVQIILRLVVMGEMKWNDDDVLCIITVYDFSYVYGV